MPSTKANPAKVKSKSTIYSVHPSMAYVQTVIANMKTKTGRAEGKMEEDTDPVKYLETAEKWVEEMFAGKKAPLRPVYDALLKLGLALGKDVKACPCKTIVPLFRENVFAQLKPTTNTRLDLGLCLRDVKGKLPARVLSTGGLEKGDRITHRIAVASIDEIDDEVKRWFKNAYESCAPK